MLSVGDLRAAVLHPVRRGATTVLMPSEAFGVGNLLYFWLQADLRRRRGAPTLVRWTERTAEWARLLPRLADELVILPRDVSFFSPREVGDMYQRFGVDFTADDLEAFLGAVLLSDEGGFARLIPEPPTVDEVTINIRRGDYYSVPAFRGRYSFDVVEYVGVALDAARERGDVRRALIVSDDLDWCRTKLARVLQGLELRFPAPGATVPEQLALLAGSRRLIITNSTFSYWGAHLATRLHGDGAEVHAPWFHSRAWGGGAATQLDPRWSIVRDLPGGWDG